MTYRIKYERKPGYLKVEVTGINSLQNVESYMRDVLAESKRQECYRVLVDERLEGPRLKVDEVFQAASEGAMRSIGVLQAIAYVDEQMGDMTYFLETVAINRGMPIKTFHNVEQAEEWLVRQSVSADEEAIFYGDDISARKTRSA